MPSPDPTAATDDKAPPADQVTRRSDTRRGEMAKLDIAQFIEFEIATQRYAFPIRQIREILILGNITPVPQTPPHVAGVSNLRGEIIPIVNLRSLFGLPHREPDDDTRTIVVNVAGKTIGAVVDSVARVLRVGKETISDPPDGIVNNGRDAIEGFAKVDGRLVIILDIRQLFSSQNLEPVRHHGEKVNG